MNHRLRIFSLLLLLLIPGYQVFADNAQEIDALFRDYSGPASPGASVMVIQNGKVVFKKAYGWADLEKKIPATTATNYDLASLTKQFTAMAIMMLAERKKLGYDDPLTTFFPDLPAYAGAITLRNLLNHTSGLLTYQDIAPPGRTALIYNNDVLALLKKQDHTYFPPGSKYRYSNSAYAVLSLVVEKVSGISFYDFLKKNIFEPLKMDHSRIYEPEDYSDPIRSVGYDPKPGGFVVAGFGGSLTPFTVGDSFLYSSVDDLYKWDQALYTTRLISAETMKLAFTPGTQTGTLGGGYGFGWFIGKRDGWTDIWHSGGNFGSTTYIHRFPEKKLTVIVLTNRNPGGDIREITGDISDLFLSDEKTAAARGELLRLHRAYSDAARNGDRKTLDLLVAPDFIRTTADGVRGRSETTVIEAPGDEAMVTEDFVKVRFYTNMAVITGRVNTALKDGASRVRFTEVWQKRPAGWQIVSSQLTPVESKN